MKIGMFANAFGQMIPDPVGQILGTGYMRFGTTEVCGLARVSGPFGQRADILAIDSTTRGTGQVHRFFNNLKKIYGEIYVWEVRNLNLAEALKRYGFNEKTEVQDGEPMRGFYWRSLVGSK